MKKICILFCLCQGFKVFAQSPAPPEEVCYRALIPMAEQPDDTTERLLFNQVPYNGLYTVRSNYHNSGYQSRIHKFDGSKWQELPELDFVLSSSYPYLNILEYHGRLLVSGSFKQFNGNYANPGTAYELIEYNNGQWVPVPGCTLDQTNVKYSIIVNSENAVYRFTQNAQNQIYGYKYDEPNSKWIRILTGHAHKNDGFVRVVGGKDRILLSTLDTLNGKECDHAVWIDKNDKSHAVSSTVGYTNFIGIDKETDIMYFGHPVYNNNVYVYDTAIVEIRNTDYHRPKPPGYGSSTIFQVYKGNLGFSMTYYSTKIFYLCKTHNDWQVIEENSPLAYPGYLIFSTKFGFFGSFPTDKRIHKLEPATLLSGNYFMDPDSNCLQDLTKESQIGGSDLSLVNSITGYKYYASLNSKGEYYIVAPKGKYTFRSTFPKYGYSPCFSNTQDIESDSTVFRDIPAKTIDKTDLNIVHSGENRWRWNTETQSSLIVVNNGNHCDSGELLVDLPAFIIAKNSNGWTFDSNNRIARLKIKPIKAGVKLLSTLSLAMDNSRIKVDSLYCFRAKVISYCPEQDSIDNEIQYCMRIVYSKDPNQIEVDKDVVPVGKATELHYFTEFQNTGGDYAEDVVITDSLPSYLNLESLRINNASHTYSAELQGRLLVFRFSGIHLLPKSENEPKSKGYVSYSIQTHPTVQQSDLIKNRAYIYFDLNEPVITNYATTLVSDLNLRSRSTLLPGFKIYPNPVRGTLFVENQEATDMPSEIYDIYGKLIWSACIKAEQTTQINTQLWPGGIYLVKAGYYTAKVIINP